MKSFAFIITATLLTASTCTRQQIEAGFAQTMIGRWEFKSSMGGYAGKRIEAETGKKLVLEFKPNQEFQKTLNDSVTEKGTYELVNVKSIYTGKTDNAIRFNAATAAAPESSRLDKIIALKGDSLSISDNFYDGFQSVYTRLK